jgi:hypothetical protein
LKLYLVDADGQHTWTGVDDKFDPRVWVSSTAYEFSSRFQLPKSLKLGMYDLRIAMVDELGSPRVRLGIDGGDNAIRYRLGSLVIASHERAN